MAAVPRPGTRFVVVSDAGAEVPNDELAVPFAGLLARRGGSRVLAAEASPGVRPAPSTPSTPPSTPGFVSRLVDDDEVATLVSTVDNLEDFRGRFSVVYALRDLGAGKIGHFGIRPGATRLVPETGQ
ncbi:MAG: copper transporter [Acidimicrobiales bacterium]